jgi:anti-sigma factor RsiW
VTPAHDDRLWLNAYIDGELDPAHVLEFEQRLAADPALAAEQARIAALRGAIRERVPRERASPQLRRRVAALARPQPVRDGARSPPRSQWHSWREVRRPSWRSAPAGKGRLRWHRSSSPATCAR